MDKKKKDLIGYICFAIPFVYYLFWFVGGMFFNIDIDEGFAKFIYTDFSIILYAPYVLYLLFFIFILVSNKPIIRFFFILLLLPNAFLQFVGLMFYTKPSDLLYYVPHIIINIFLIWFSIYMSDDNIKERKFKKEKS